VNRYSLALLPKREQKISKVDYSSKAKGSNVGDFLIAKNTVTYFLKVRRSTVLLAARKSWILEPLAFDE
jgi:hypothetical protein